MVGYYNGVYISKTNAERRHVQLPPCSHAKKYIHSEEKYVLLLIINGHVSLNDSLAFFFPCVCCGRILENILPNDLENKESASIYFVL